MSPQGGKSKKKAWMHSPEVSGSRPYQQRQPSLAPLPEEVKWESLTVIEYNNQAWVGTINDLVHVNYMLQDKLHKAHWQMEA